MWRWLKAEPLSATLIMTGCRNQGSQYVADDRSVGSFAWGTVNVDARCRVIGGTWRDAYSGLFHTDPSVLDVDHFVPLAEAHRSGGWR